MSTVTNTCRNCGTKLAVGSSFCTLCGAAVYNRAGRSAVADPATEKENPRSIQIPGIVPVTPFSRGPAVAPKIIDGDEMATRLDLVTASAGKRLSAKLIDMVIPAIVMTICFVVGSQTIVSTRVNAQVIQLDLLGFSIWAGVGALLSLAYWVFLWGWEARTGKTFGNLMLGVRTTNVKGFAPGWLAVFVRSLIISIGFAVAFLGGVVVLLSNLWDPNSKRQGWHDKAAHTLVFDIKAGRDTLTSGGIDGPASFAPVELPAMVPVQSPVAGASPFPPSSPVPGFEPTEQPTHDPNQWQPPSAPAAWSSPLPGAVHPDEEVEATKFRPRDGFNPAEAAEVAPANPAPSLRISLEDGRNFVLTGAVLIGRNPSGYDGEVIDQLMDVQDQSRSVSKTHLHLLATAEGLWVTDRNSTNGSTVTLPDGARTRLSPGTAMLAPVGSTVGFGDRFLIVGQG